MWFSFSMLIIFTILLLLMRYLAKRISQWVLWVLLQWRTTLINLTLFLLLLPSATICRFFILERCRVRCYARVKVKYQIFLMKRFILINVVIYITFLVFHLYYLLSMGRARFNNFLLNIVNQFQNRLFNIIYVVSSICGIFSSIYSNIYMLHKMDKKLS